MWQAEQRPSESRPVRMSEPCGRVALHGKRNVADVITLGFGDREIAWIIQAGPMSSQRS